MSNLYRMATARSLGVPDIGQTLYLVDSNYRTAAQGWFRPDGTGPGDLANSRNKDQGYVFLVTALPPAASLTRTREITAKATEELGKK